MKELKKKILWQCRRGLKELDSILIPFAENNFCNLRQEDKLIFEDLLKNQDIELSDWLIYKFKHPDLATQRLINLILREYFKINETK